MKNGIKWLQTAPLISCIWLLTACTMEDIPVKPDDSVSDDVRLTQIYTEVSYPSTGMLVTSTTVDLVWENGLLKNQNSTTYSPLTGKTTDLGENTYVYNGNDCIEKHYISPNQNVNEYFTYANGRMTSAVKMSGDDNTRWKDVGGTECREWWEVASLSDGQMRWAALRQNADGTTFEQGMRWKKVE